MEPKEWMEKAEHDLNTAKINFRENVFDAAAFFCQQAVEKALKALYIKRFRKLFKTHDLYFLGKKVEVPKHLLDICDEISSFYIETRYPDTYAKFEKTSVQEAIRKSEKVLKWAKEKL